MVMPPSAGDSPERLASDSLIRWIRTVMWGALVVPALGFMLISAWGYQRAVAEAQSKVGHASALSLRQAERILEIARKVAALADDATQGSDADVRAGEAGIHQRFADLCAGLGFVVNMNVWAADGSPLVRSDIYPVDRSASVLDRQYFIEQREVPDHVGISEVLSGRNSGRELFNLTVRRRASDGRFNGIVAVSLSPESFRDYYRSLAFDEPDLASFAIVRADGTLLARWPAATPDHTNVDADNPVFLQVRAGASEGLVVVPERDGRESRLISFRRVQGLPVYVTAGVSKSSVIVGWLHFTALLLAIILPVTLGLAWVSWIALKKTRQEQTIADAMRQEVQLRAQAEKAALEGQKLHTLSQLTGGVAHDFNNLLTIVSNNLHILGRRHPELAGDKHLSAVFRAVQSGVRLTRQLLSFSRKQALRPETIDLRDWLPSTEGLVRSTLGNRTRLEYRVEPDVGPIRVDVAELELALINTALNAQHAMMAGGLLRITAANAPDEEPPMVVVGVEDSGAGIAPDLLDRVFEPFFSTKGAGKGSGLGLSQVAGLCEQAGGFADIESVVGQGTTVRMHFPAMPGAALRPMPPEPDVIHQLEGRVLLVEDNADVALATEQVLGASGLKVVCVADADAALEQLATEMFDLVLSDISMPGSMDGIELALHIRARWPRTPVVLTTGYADKIHVAVGAGLRVLAKPVHPDEVLREIFRALQGRATADRATAA
jgi:two-component system NtrC family sensor kinase